MPWRWSSPSARPPSIHASPSSSPPSWRARRGAETLTSADAVGSLVVAFEAGLRKTLARMGISAVASYIGGALIDVIDLDASVVERCFPTAAAWPGRRTLRDIADRQLRRRAVGDGDPGAARRPGAAPARSRVRSLPRRRRGASLLTAHRGRDPGPRRARRGGERDLPGRCADRHRRRARTLPGCARAAGGRPRRPAR